MSGDGALRGFVKIARDVTDSKQKETAREAMLQRDQGAEPAAVEAILERSIALWERGEELAQGVHRPRSST